MLASNIRKNSGVVVVNTFQFLTIVNMLFAIYFNAAGGLGSGHYSMVMAMVCLFLTIVQQLAEIWRRE